MDVLSRLTIVIPTIGRPDYVRRQIQYWSDLQVKLVIIDGSPDPIPNIADDLPERFSYAHTAGDFQSRMLTSVNYVATEFVAVLGDDDFFSPTGLRDCINRLDEDRSIIGCVGRSIRFVFQDGRVLAEQRDPQSTEFPKTVATGLERLYATYHPGKIGALMYGVYRFEPWRDVVQATYCVGYKTAYIYDTIIRVLLTYRSSIGLVETVTWYCSAENPPVKIAPGWNRLLGGVEWLTSSGSEAEVEDCRNRMIDDLAMIGNDRRGDIESAVDFVISELLRRYAVKAAQRTKLTTRAKMAVVTMSPRFIRRVGKRVLPSRLKGSFDWKFLEFDRLLIDLTRTGIKVDEDDAQKVADHVRRTHLSLN